MSQVRTAAIGEAVAAPPAAATRITSVDALRGFVMLLMLAEAMRLWTVRRAYPESGFWAWVAYHTTHVPWQGCSLHDLIQPAFSFLVGVALPFSIASRMARGQSFNRMFGHAVWRSLALIFLGIILRSIGRPQIYWTFEDTLTQIGLGYAVLFLLFIYLTNRKIQAGPEPLEDVETVAVTSLPDTFREVFRKRPFEAGPTPLDSSSASPEAPVIPVEQAP